MASLAFQDTSHDTSIDRLTRAHVIRDTFARSPLFCDAAVSELVLGPEGKVELNVSFDGEPTLVRVVAESVNEAYAILHELAVAMVDVEQGRWARC
jgi:hypothetical protein